MKIFVGTSGWMYDWNPDGFDWYIMQSGLNAVELNASFYRFPFRNQVSSWAKKGSSIRWSIKVNRLVTHIYKFSDKGFDVWNKFKELFDLMNSLIDFYLFQLPPSLRFTDTVKNRLKNFIEKSDISSRIAIESRSIDWFTHDGAKFINSLGCVFVSVDAPNLPRSIFVNDGVVYLRMHGRYSWYMHNYSEDELKEIVYNILKSEPDRVYVFFNNNHDMLNNARLMLKLFSILELR
ncbi:MAG: DUF72 domain-containing protein [Thermoprotei archaeon]|jgi:uncharacterized protein YecE (DUF72 family)